MKSNAWNKLIFWSTLSLLLFLNTYTLIHAVSGWILGIELFLCLFFIRRFLLHKDDKFLKYAAFFLWGFLILAQIGFVFALRTNIRYDAYWILDQAVEMLSTHKLSPTISNAYFTQVPNNYGITIITYWFLNCLQFLGVPSSCFMRAVQLFNTAFIDLSLFFIWMFMRRTKGNSTSVLFLFFCVISPYPYVWAPYYYTSTTSMMFACAAVFLWLCICKTSSRRIQYLLAALMGILCITGYQVRATSLIAYIAIFLFWSIRHEKGSLKKHARPLLLFFLTTALSFVSWKGIINHYVPFDTRDTALPVTHFMMMGTRWDGSFNMDDLRYSISLPTKEEKLKGTLSVIRERLTENGLAGNIKLLLNKQLNCWVDGTDSFTTEHALCTDFNLLHPYIMGSKSGYLAAYAQIFRAIQLFLVCSYAIFSMMKKRADTTFLLALNLLGGMVFHLLWETSPLYSIPFTLFSYALAVDGLGQLADCSLFQKKVSSYALLASSALCLLVSGIYLIAQRATYTKEVHFLTDSVVAQHMETAGENGPDMKVGQVWTQTFEAETPFNILELYYGNPGMEGNTSSYNITLSDEHGTVFYQDILYGDDTGYDLDYEIQFEPVIPQGRTTYTISIEPLAQDQEHYLHFSSQDCSRVDLYPHGSLSIDGVPVSRDLSFRVQNLHLGTLATRKEYYLFAILLLSLELFIVFKAFCLIHQKRRPIP